MEEAAVDPADELRPLGSEPKRKRWPRARAGAQMPAGLAAKKVRGGDGVDDEARFRAARPAAQVEPADAQRVGAVGERPFGDERRRAGGRGPAVERAGEADRAVRGEGDRGAARLVDRGGSTN